ncbi:hypothetical protein BD560DRAFT_432599 [Blakeslea trispora]|nr:hypothetical protein BD560DRAFT_432599 [Blakeslea trispora]
MLTNNYIESWHNQLKIIFLGRVQNKRLDKLTFVLVNDVEYYLGQEFERVVQGNGAMSPFFEQQRIRKLVAEEVDEERRSGMISGPVDGANLEVTGDKVIASCTCFDYDRRRKPCKHMCLLKMHTNCSVFVSSNTTTSAETLNVSEPSENQLTSSANSKLDMAKYCIDINQTSKHFSPEDEMAQILNAQKRTLEIIQKTKDKYEVNFRTSHTRQWLNKGP